VGEFIYLWKDRQYDPPKEQREILKKLSSRAKLISWLG